MSGAWAAAILLDKRKPKARNVIIGSDRPVIKALERKYNIKIDRFSLEIPVVFSWIDQESEVPLAERASIAFWKNPPITKNRELLTYIISTMLPDMLEKERIALINRFTYDSEAIRDFDVLYWRIRAALSVGAIVWDKQPWEDPRTWVGRTDPDTRLSRLYHDLRGYVYTKVGNKPELKTLGLSAQKIKYLDTLDLSNKKITETLGILAKWRYQTLNGQQAVFLVSNVWSPR